MGPQGLCYYTQADSITEFLNVKGLFRPTTNIWTDIYSPQRSCSKVMFLHLSVILFTGGVSVQGSLCQGDPPPAHAVQLRAGGTHPTGMLSCILYFLRYFDSLNFGPLIGLNAQNTYLH